MHALGSKCWRQAKVSGRIAGYTPRNGTAALRLGFHPRCVKHAGVLRLWEIDVGIAPEQISQCANRPHLDSPPAAAIPGLPHCSLKNPHHRQGGRYLGHLKNSIDGADAEVEEGKVMATTAAISTSRGNLVSRANSSGSGPRGAQRAVVSSRRRRISREAGRAMETLGHAIDYLADEFALDCMTAATVPRHGMHPRIAAIELLKERSREILLSCPQAPSLADRLGILRRLLRA
jgi:hypothetical protein